MYAECVVPDPAGWERRRHHVASTQQLGETLINHHLKKKVSKIVFYVSEGGAENISNVNLNHIASNLRNKTY